MRLGVWLWRVRMREYGTRIHALARRKTSSLKVKLGGGMDANYDLNLA
jgi:hypothetical protein